MINLFHKLMGSIFKILEWSINLLDSVIGDVLRLAASVANAGVRVFYCVLIYQLAVGDLMDKVLGVLS